MFGREAPPELLKQLREICPRADLIYWGEGTWRLGRWNPRVGWNPDAAERLGKIWEWPDSDTRHRNIILERMRLRGFAVTADYRFDGNEDWGLVREDFRRRIFNLHNRAKEILANLENDQDMEMGKMLVEDALMEGYDRFKSLLGRPTATVQREIH